ncbi:rod shape-determining protein MreC [Novosphingobium sp.]|uniref:rod shape-determining protein MreC n=1 Tax=Novosphingobium sp. TaxID=1874826 RepID=UPI0038BD2AB8
MARLPDRRPGFSRRAQYGIFTGYVVAIGGAVIGAVLLVVSLIQPEAFGFARTAANEVGRPSGVAAAHSRTIGQAIYATVGAYFNAGQQNAALSREVAAARANAVTARAVADENHRLKALLGIVDPVDRPVTAARLIGSTAQSARRYAVLNEGSFSGISAGQSVRAAAGLIGRVVEAGPHTARVLLVTDPENVVPVRRVGDGLPAFVQGAANGTVEIRLINMGLNPLHKGDVFVTSGSGGLYPPNVPVAIATAPHRDGASGRLASDPADTDFVVVLPVFQPGAVAALEASRQAAGPPPPADEGN